MECSAECAVEYTVYTPKALYFCVLYGAFCGAFYGAFMARFGVSSGIVSANRFPPHPARVGDRVLTVNGQAVLHFTAHTVPGASSGSELSDF